MQFSKKHSEIQLPFRYKILLGKITGLLQVSLVLSVVFPVLIIFFPARTCKPVCLTFLMLNGIFIILLLSWISRIKLFMKETGLMVSNSKDMMWIMNSQLNVTGVCGNVEQICGKQTMAVLNKPLTAVLPEDERDRFNTLVRENNPFSMTCTILKDADIKHPVEIRANPIYLSGQNTFYGIIKDASDQMRIHTLEKELNSSKRLKNLGRLAGSIAHDLNNILAGMATYPEILLLDKNLAPGIRESLVLIKESGRNASAVVSDLLTISRSSREEYQVLNLNTVIKRFVAGPEFEKLKAAYPDIQIDIHLNPGLLTMSASYLHIEKSIMHLMVHALEQTAATASDGPGQICLSTANHYMAEQGKNKPSPGEYVMLEVQDSGPQIPEQNLKKIFEPFFIQKKMGRPGTGLGLTVVKDTVLNHRGEIFATSDENGTKITLLFPALRQEMPLANQPPSLEQIRGNGETLLVVDDLASQRKIAETILKNLGYKVFSVADGVRAFEFIIQTPVDLLILDMVMAPSISGLETLRRIKKIYPAQKAIIASGHSASEDVLKALSEGAGAFVKKPFTIQDLGIAVKEELDK